MGINKCNHSECSAKEVISKNNTESSLLQGKGVRWGVCQPRKIRHLSRDLGLEESED